MSSTGILFLLSWITFMLVYCKNPGYSKSLEIGEFAEILDRAIKDGRNLDYFCFFCRSLWSSSSVHCMTCGKCVEGFDHHCVFVNNCIGYRNHANFLVFLMLSFVYTMVLISNSVWTVYEKLSHCFKAQDQGLNPPFCNFHPMSLIVLGACFLFCLISIFQTVPIFW